MASERAFNAALGKYETALRFVMRHRPMTIVFSVLVLGLTAVVFTRVSKGLFPPEDTGELDATTESAQGTSFEEMSRLQTRLATLLSKDRCIESFTSALGGGGTAGATNQGNLWITLKPPTQRPSADECVEEITKHGSTIPGLELFLQNP